MFVLTNYVRLSNQSSDYMIADVGSVLENDAGTMGGHVSIGLDRRLYDYNCYHFNIGSLGTDLASYVRQQSAQTGFAVSSGIRTQPAITNLLSADDSVATAEYSTLLPDLAVLKWDF